MAAKSTTKMRMGSPSPGMMRGSLFRPIAACFGKLYSYRLCLGTTVSQLLEF